jgi:hypothetical protein
MSDAATVATATTEADRASDMKITLEKISRSAKGDMNAAEEAFQQKFPGSDMKSMIFLGEDYEQLTFLLDDLRIVGFDEYREPKFYEVQRFNLSTKGATRIQSEEAYTETNVKLIEDDGVITYELYAFEQCYEIPFEVLLKVLKLDQAEAEQLETQNEESENEELDDDSLSCGDLFLCRVDATTTIHVSEDQIYSVRRGGEIVSAFEGPDYEFQLGVGDTRCFLVKSKDMLIIENRGDVSSVVIVYFNTGVILM